MEALHHAVRKTVREDGDVFLLVGDVGLAGRRVPTGVPGAVRRLGDEQAVRFGLRHDGMLAPDTVALGIRVVAATSTTAPHTGLGGDELVVLRVVRPRVVRDAIADGLAHEGVLAVHVLGVGPRGQVGVIATFHDGLEQPLLIPVLDRRRRNLGIAFRKLHLLLLSDLRICALGRLVGTSRQGDGSPQQQAHTNKLHDLRPSSRS